MEQQDNQDTQAPNEQPNTQSRRNFSAIAIPVMVLIFLVVIGYVIIDTVLQVRRSASPITNLPGSVATQVDEVLNPTPTIIADPVTVIRQVQNLSRLETASYTIEKVITAESGDDTFGFLFRDRLLLVAHGQVIAGVDLGRMEVDDIDVVNSTVYVTMPAAEIFVAALDSQQTYVYDRETAVFGQQIDLETLARQEAERAILEAAIEDGILTLAHQNAQIYLDGMLLALGFEEVVFIEATPTADQVRSSN